MLLKYYSVLEESCLKVGVIDLVKRCNYEFIPPLSCRRGIQEKNLSQETSFFEDNIESYLNSLFEQSFIVALENEKVVGFMSFRENYIPAEIKVENMLWYNFCYVSTIIVDREYRKHGLATQFYHELFKLFDLITTRTWSINYGHLNILQKLDFKLVKRISNDRGENIDTVYFLKNVKK